MIATTKDWLHSLHIEAKGNENSGNHNPKPQDMSLDILKSLFNQGYDRVTWVGSDRDKEENEICKKYDDAGTTWTLEAFLCTASLNSNFHIVAMKKEDYSEKDWQDIVSRPGKALKFAQENNFSDLPSEIIDSISSDDLVSSRFINRFLKINSTDSIPESIVKSVVDNSSVEELYYLYDIYQNQPNLPLAIKEKCTTKNFDNASQRVYDKENLGNLPFDAPIFSHSHVGCRCYLQVWKSEDPSDFVLLDSNGMV